MKPPPWSHTMTGKRVRAGTGVHTLRYRQSSVELATMTSDCGQRLPGAVALRVPVHGEAGCGGRQRKRPEGGAAYGIPRKERTPPMTSPRSTPPATFTELGST